MKVIVVGAYGFTGKLVCQQLNKEKITFGVAGRNTDKLMQLTNELEFINKTITIDIMDEKSISPILNFDIIINCIGPFHVYANLLLEASVAQSKIYFDITGEETFVSESIKKYGILAKQNKATIVHAAAFESALVNVLSYLLVESITNITSINTYYRFEKSKPSPGTRFTMKLSKYRDTFFMVDGEKIAISSLEKKQPSSFSIQNEKYFQIPYPMPEIPLIHKTFGIKNIASYLLVDEFSASISFSKKKENENLTKEIEKFQNRKTIGPTLEQRKAQYFDLIVEGISDKGLKKQLLLNGNDMYLVTAKIIGFLVKRQLKEKITNYGVLSTHELIKGKEKAFFEYVGVTLTSLKNKL